jgi:hypothetical protein
MSMQKFAWTVIPWHKQHTTLLLLQLVYTTYAERKQMRQHVL